MSNLTCLAKLASSCLRGSWQAPFWHGSGLQLPLLQLQQLHTTAAQAAPVAAPQQQQQQAPEQPEQQQQSEEPGSSGQLQSAGSPVGPLLTTLQSGLSSQQLGPESMGLYYDFDRRLVPEAFQGWHQAFYAPRPAKAQRKGGCRGLQAELALSHSSSLMWRRSSQEVQQLLASGAAPRLYLRGPPGAGKSITLVQMVEWARNNGWIALYLPCAGELTRGGFFYRRPEDDTYDTLISAQHLLKSLADSHADQLGVLPLQLPGSRALMDAAAAAPTAAAAAAALPAGAGGGGGDAPLDAESGGAAAGGGGSAEGQAGGGSSSAKGKKGGGRGKAATAASTEGTVMQLVVTGLSTDDDARLAVECVLALVRELAALSQQQPVLLAVDNYSALYHTTDYGKTVFVTPQTGPPYQYRKPIKVKQLNLAREMRLLERTDLGAARVLVADSGSSRLPVDLVAPHASASTYALPRFSEVEVAHALHFYHERGLTALPPSQRQVSAMRALTNGSGTDLRRWCLKVTQTDLGML